MSERSEDDSFAVGASRVAHERLVEFLLTKTTSDKQQCQDVQLYF